MGFTPSRSAFKDSASTGRTARQQEINMSTLQTIKAIWISQPLSEKIAGVVTAIAFPILMIFLAAVAP